MEYECFVKRLEDVKENRQLILTLRDLSAGPRKYDARIVRALVSRAPDALAHWDQLWVRSAVGVKDPQPWGVKVVEELGDSLPGRPYTDIFEAAEQVKGKEVGPRDCEKL